MLQSLITTPYVMATQVDSLQYATLATVSRCGMVWFSASEDDARVDDDAAGAAQAAGNTGTVSNDMLLRHKVSQERKGKGSI